MYTTVVCIQCTQYVSICVQITSTNNVVSKYAENRIIDGNGVSMLSS